MTAPPSRARHLQAIARAAQEGANGDMRRLACDQGKYRTMRLHPFQVSMRSAVCGALSSTRSRARTARSACPGATPVRASDPPCRSHTCVSFFGTVANAAPSGTVLPQRHPAEPPANGPANAAGGISVTTSPPPCLRRYRCSERCAGRTGRAQLRSTRPPRTCRPTRPGWCRSAVRWCPSPLSR